MRKFPFSSYFPQILIVAITEALFTSPRDVRDSSGYPFSNNLSFPEPIRLAITMPLTSRQSPMTGTVEERVAGLRFFGTFLPSFIETAYVSKNSSDSFPCTFEFWIGYDRGDPLFDTLEGRTGFEAFFTEQLLDFDKKTFCGISSEVSNAKLSCVKLHLMAFNYTNTLTALWNGLNAAAYQDGVHYIFMPNDDLWMHTIGWPGEFLRILENSELIPNFGVTGPVDPVSGQGDIPSMPFVHRTHLEIFPTSLPSTFQNWYNDIWLGNVYRPFGGCLLARAVRAENHHGCADRAHCSRYDLGGGAHAPWREEAIRGRGRVAAWLRARGVAVRLEELARAPVTLG